MFLEFLFLFATKEQDREVKKISVVSVVWNYLRSLSYRWEWTMLSGSHVGKGRDSILILGYEGKEGKSFLGLCSFQCQDQFVENFIFQNC